MIGVVICLLVFISSVLSRMMRKLNESVVVLYAILDEKLMRPEGLMKRATKRPVRFESLLRQITANVDIFCGLARGNRKIAALSAIVMLVEETQDARQATLLHCIAGLLEVAPKLERMPAGAGDGNQRLIDLIRKVLRLMAEIDRLVLSQGYLRPPFALPKNGC